MCIALSSRNYSYLCPFFALLQPWVLIKHVAVGAARGMTYLHGGKPPVLHRDLKSANLLLDDSYTTKVADFGLSRIKAQERSMTGNCGTVQWMAPEVCHRVVPFYVRFHPSIATYLIFCSYYRSFPMKAMPPMSS